MRSLFFIALLVSFALGGFFNAESNASKKEDIENERLCKLFTEKAKAYKKNMRQDELAVKTLRSYEKRASRYCIKAK